MAKKFVLFPFMMLMLLIVMWSAAQSQTVQARDPLNVELDYFIATGIATGVQLDWETSTEYNTASFRIKRATSGNGPFVFIDVWQDGEQISIVPVQNPGSPETGGVYSVQDLAAAIGQTYWYTLVEIEMDGNEIDLETHATVAGLPTPTPTATGQVIGGGNNGGTTATATPTPTGTQPATSPTTAPQNTTVPAATATTQANTAPPTTQPTRGSTGTGSTTTTGGNNSGSNNSGTTGSSNSTTTSGTTSSAAQPVAQITPAPTTAGYPAPGGVGNSAPEQTPLPTEAAYPDGQPTIAPDLNVTSYPLQEGTPAGTEGEAYQGNGSPVTDFGNDSDFPADGTLPAPVESTMSTTSSTRGRVVLWVGFLGGLLIFAAGVFGTILLFTRKQNGPQ